MREIGIASCPKAALVEARTTAIAHLRLNSILGPRQITQSPNYETVFAAVPTVNQNQPLIMHSFVKLLKEVVVFFLVRLTCETQGRDALNANFLRVGL